jgi:hypothetical protein
MNYFRSSRTSTSDTDHLPKFFSVQGQRFSGLQNVTTPELKVNSVRVPRDAQLSYLPDRFCLQFLNHAFLGLFCFVSHGL